MFLEALLAGGSNVEVEEGEFTVTNQNVAATIPVQMQDYDYLEAWADEKIYNCVCWHYEMKIITGDYKTSEIGWNNYYNVVDGRPPKQIQIYVAPTTWHYRAIKLAS